MRAATTLPGIELQRLVQRVDGAGFVFLLAERAPEAHPRGEIGRIDLEAGAEDLLGFIEMPRLPQLLGELVEETALRIRLELEAQLFDFCGRRRLSHRGT